MGRKVRRIRSSGGKGLLNWLAKNWWLLPALIIIFGALAWVDPDSPGPGGTLGGIAAQSLGGNILDIRNAAMNQPSTGSKKCKKNSECHCSGGKCSGGKCTCAGGLLPSQRKYLQLTI